MGTRRVPRVERDLDVSVRLTNRARVVVDRIDRRNISPDIVCHRCHLSRRDDLADRLLHIGEPRGGLLNAHADRRPHVQQNLAAVDLWEEIAAEKWHKEKRDGNEAEKAPDKRSAIRHGECQQIMIGVTQSLEVCLEAALQAHQRVLRRLWLAGLLVLPDGRFLPT